MALPTVPFGRYRISRLVMGDNPIYGYSHFNQLLSQHQREANTPEQVMATLRAAEAAGINAWQNTITERSLSDLRRYREAGGAIHWFCLSTASWLEEPDQIREAARHRPIGMAPHGGAIGDRCLRSNQLSRLDDLLKRIRDTGVMVGLSVHDPKLLGVAEEKQWDVDYYMTALYHLRGAREEFVQEFGYEPLGEIYLREHRDRMLQAIQHTPKPCLVFKVLAAGRAIRSKDEIRQEFQYALSRIKPNDCLLVGMYQKWNNQIGENAKMVEELCRASDRSAS